MKKNIKIIIAAALVIAAAIGFLAYEGYLPPGRSVFIDGVRVQTEGDMLRLSGETGKIRARGNLGILLDGPASARELSVGGTLYVFGDGSLEVDGPVKAAVMIVSDGAAVFSSGLKLRRGPYVSPLYTVEGGSVLPPVEALFELGYSDAVKTQTLKYGDCVPVPEDPEREGWRFSGWYADAGLTLPFDFGQPLSEDTAVYAAWTKLVTLSFDSWGGSFVEAAVTDIGTPAAEPDAPVRTEHSFTGWYADRSLTQPYDFSSPVWEDATVYAKWNKDAVTVASGVDVSRYQGEIDWPRLVRGGAEFAVIRAGFRGYGAEGRILADESFEDNIDGALEAGLDAGVYFFSQAVSEAEAVEEAEFVLELLNGRELTLPVFIDYELMYAEQGGYTGRLYDAGLSGEEYARICAAFCRRVEQEGYTAMVYAGVDMLRDIGEELEKQGYGAWLANWTGQTRYEGSFEYWQYSGSGSAAGVKGEVDLDFRYVNSPHGVTGAELKDGVLTWDKQKGAYGYIIYRCTPDEDGYSELARTKGAAMTELRDKSAPTGSKYMICAYVLQSGTEYRGGFSRQVS